MTSIFPLESYPEIYAASLLFQEQDFLNTNTSLRDVHRFWKERKEQTYIKENYATQLSLKTVKPSLQSLGVQIDETNNSLFIVPDNINALTLKELLDINDQYLYRSVYHYWNYLSQLRHILPLNTPIIFLDLNQLTPEEYTPITLIEKEGNLHPVPVLGNRQIKELHLQHDCKETYHQFIQKIAISILREYPKDINNTLKHLTTYLKKIRLLQCDLNSPLKIELLYQGKIYYKLVQLNNIDITPLQSLIINIDNLANQHTGYHFVVVSDYNTIPEFRNAFTCENIVTPNTSQNIFNHVWQYKKTIGLCLYGQYLDQIEFMFKRDGQKEWFKILSSQQADQIYYEGDNQTRTFTACLTDNDNNIIQDTFCLSIEEVNLPIKINDQEYCKNGAKQAYYISHPQIEQNKDIDKLTPITVQIELIVRIGTVPLLRVRDINEQYVINTRMGDILPAYYNCLPLADILTRRRKDLQRTANRDRCQEIISILSQSDFYDFNFAEKIQVLQQVEQSMMTRGRVYNQLGRSGDLLLDINPDLEDNYDIKEALNCNLITAISDLIVRYAAGTFNIPTSFSPEQRSNHRQNIINWTILIGKTYRFLPLSIVERFFQQKVISGGFNSRRIGQESSRCLARLAREKRFQLSYFSIFNTQLEQDKIPYQVDHYIWGYWRILRWYSDFDYSQSEVNYSSHFTLLLNYLLNANLGQNYLQDAFLSLIYLLTFREKDATFCVKKSPEYDLAKRVTERYKDAEIRQSVLPNNTLVGYFNEYLEGTSEGEAGLLDIS